LGGKRGFLKKDVLLNTPTKVKPGKSGRTLLKGGKDDILSTWAHGEGDSSLNENRSRGAKWSRATEMNYKAQVTRAMNLLQKSRPKFGGGWWVHHGAY